jgi:hypothetical protein
MRGVWLNPNAPHLVSAALIRKGFETFLIKAAETPLLLLLPRFVNSLFKPKLSIKTKPYLSGSEHIKIFRAGFLNFK